MLLILGVPLLFRRLRLPGLVGLIVAGAVVGPHALGILARDATFELLGTVGLLYLMFVAGLSLDLNQFARLRTRSLIFGLISYTIPQGLAVALSMPLLGFDWMQALLLGAIVGSHTLLAYPIATRLGIDKNTAVVMTVGGTMVTDLASLLVLAVVVALLQGAAGALFWVQFVLVVAGYILAVLWVLPRLGRWFFRAIRKQADVEFAFLVAVLFLAAYLADVARLAPIIGAFLAGLAMNRLVPVQSSLMTRVRFVGDALFIPFFLISVGMLVDLSVLAGNLAVWGMALLFSALVLVGKGLAAHLTGRIYGYTRDEGWVIHGLSSPQAAATLAVTLVAFDLGLFSALIVNAVVAMILITSLAGPLLVERFGRAVALHQKRQPVEASEAPQRILVPLANPDHADDLMDIALLLHEPTSEQPVYTLAVAREAGEPVAQAEQLLSGAIVHASAADVPIHPVTRIDLNAAAGIARTVQELRISTIVIGWQGRDTARTVIFGSILDQLLSESHAMTVVCRIAHPLHTASRLLLLAPPYIDREPGFAGGLQAIKSLADQAGLDLILLAEEASAETLVPLVERAKPAVPVTPYLLDRWADLPRTLDMLVTEDDLIVLLRARRGAVSWRPSLDRLPALIAQRYAASNFLATFLADVPVRQLVTEALASADGQLLLTRAIQAGSLNTAVEGGDVERVLAQVLDEAEGLTAPLPVVVEELLGGAPNYAPELLPGVVLYHAHTDYVEVSTLAVGLSDAGLRLPSTSQPAHVVLILLVPRSLSAEDYLRELVLATHLVPNQAMVEALRDCPTPDEVQHLLLESLDPVRSRNVPA